jgi:hypothetical protein
MKPRDAEAARLEQDYLARVRVALAGRPEGEIAEVIESVREHIEEAAAALEGPEITLAQMAEIQQLLGPPGAYGEGESRAAGGSALPAGGVGETAAAAPAARAGIDYIHKPFDFANCFGDALALYTQNFLPLLLVSIVFDLLSIASLLILCGPLAGGVCLMCLRALERPDHSVDFGDLFRMFHKFWPLLGLFLYAAVAETAGLMACIVPGLLLMAVWSLPVFFIVDKGLGVMASLGASYRTTTAPNRFMTNFLLTLAMFAIGAAAGSIPYIGFAVQWFVWPLVWFVGALAYARQTRGIAVGAQADARLAVAV